MIAPASTQFVQEDSNFLWKFGQFQVGDGNKCLTILIFDVACCVLHQCCLIGKFILKVKQKVMSASLKRCQIVGIGAGLDKEWEEGR